MRLSVRLWTQHRYRSPGFNSSPIAVKLDRDVPGGKISDEFVHGRRGSLNERFNELINYFDLLSPLPLFRVQFFRDRGQTWWGYTLSQYLSRVHSWGTWLIKSALNELINYFDLLSPIPLSRVQFFSDRGQTWWGYTLGQDISFMGDVAR